MYTSTDNYDLMWEAAKTSISDHIVLPFIWKLLFLEHLLRSNMKRKISQLFNAWFVFSFTSREDNQQLLRNTKNKPNYIYHKSSWSKSSAWTLANQRGERKDRNIITGFKQLPNMQLSSKLTHLFISWFDLLLNVNIIKGVGQQIFFTDVLPLHLLHLLQFFLCYFSFIFRLRNPVMCSRSRFWVTWRRQSRILSVSQCTKFSGVSTIRDRYKTLSTKELSHFPWSFWRYATRLKILLTHFRYNCRVPFAISDAFSTRAITYEDVITITLRIRGLFNLMENTPLIANSVNL